MNKNKKSSNNKGGLPDIPLPPVPLPAIPTIQQMSTAPVSLGSSINLSSSNMPDMMLSSSNMALTQSESPFLALTAQERELRKLLMASIKKPFRIDGNAGKSTEEIDVREAFKLKPLKSIPIEPKPIVIVHSTPASSSIQIAPLPAIPVPAPVALNSTLHPPPILSVSSLPLTSTATAQTTSISTALVAISSTAAAISAASNTVSTILSSSLPSTASTFPSNITETLVMSSTNTDVDRLLSKPPASVLKKDKPKEKPKEKAKETEKEMDKEVGEGKGGKSAKKIKAVKEKEEPKVIKPKDKEEIARSNKEKEEKNLFRLKQLNHDLVQSKFNTFFTHESSTQQILRKNTFQDNLLEEIQWMAIDFRQERRWKMATSRSIGTACSNIFLAREQEQSKRCEESLKPLRSIASKISSDVKRYWTRFDIYEDDPDDLVTAESIASMDTGKALSEKVLHEVIDEVLPLLIESLRAKRTIFTGENTVLSMKQIECINRVVQINEIGYGAILIGNSHVGKTSLSAYLIQEWLLGAQQRGRSTCVLLVAPWFAIQLWNYRLSQLNVSVEIWNRSIHMPPSKGVLIVCSKDAAGFCKVLSKHKSHFGGVVVDCREVMAELVKSTSNPEIFQGSSKWEESYDWMKDLFAHIDSSTSYRCLVMNDLENCRANKSLILSGLFPSYFSYKHPPDLPRRCLDFMERLKVKCELDNHIQKHAEQTVVAVPMTVMQKKKYASLLFRSEYDSIHDALTLVKRICFHEMLVPDYLLNLPENAPVATGKAICPSFAAVTLTLNRYPTFNLSRIVDYRSFQGSGKMEKLISNLKDPNNLQKRIMIIVSTELELTITHKYLLNYQVGHYYAPLTHPPVLALIHTQDILRSFNNHQDPSAVILITDAVFSYPYISPANVDLVFVLGTNWSTALSINRCLRNKEKGQTSLYRFVAADTLEELLERKGGSFLHLQGYRIPDVRNAPSVKTVQTFAFDSTKLLHNAPQNLLIYIKEMAAPPVPRGLGKGKGLFLTGLQTVNAQVDNDEVDNGYAEWISKFYYDLGFSEMKICGKLENSNPQFGWPLLSVRRGVVEKDIKFHRLVVTSAFSRYRSHIVDVSTDIRTVIASVNAFSAVSKVSASATALLPLLFYTKASAQSTFQEDFNKTVNVSYRDGTAVDPCLYISPLCNSVQKRISILPPKNRNLKRPFNVLFMPAPDISIPKLPPLKKSRSNNPTGTSVPRRKPSISGIKKPISNLSAQNADSVGTQSDKEHLGQFDEDLNEFDSLYLTVDTSDNFGLFEDETFADLDDLDF